MSSNAAVLADAALAVAAPELIATESEPASVEAGSQIGVEFDPIIERAPVGWPSRGVPLGRLATASHEFGERLRLLCVRYFIERQDRPAHGAGFLVRHLREDIVGRVAIERRHHNGHLPIAFELRVHA